MSDMLAGARADAAYAFDKWYESGSDLMSVWRAHGMRHSGRVQAIKEMLGQIEALR